MPRVWFARPEWLLLLALAVLFVWLAAWDAIRRRDWASLKNDRGLAIGLRMATLGCLVLAAAGPVLSLPSRRLDVTFAVDQSQSVTRVAPQAAADWLAQAAKYRGRADQTGLVAFGAQAAAVQALGSATPDLNRAPQTDGTATDIGGAIAAAAHLFGPARPGRIVLLTDGRETAGDAVLQARLAHAAGLEVDTVALGDNVPEVSAAGLTLPTTIRQDEGFAVTLTVESNVATSARIQLQVDNQPSAQASVNIRPGSNSFTLQQAALPAGQHTLTASVNADQDTLADDNQVQAAIFVQGQPSILVLEGAPDDGQWLAQALQADNLLVQRTAAQGADLSLDRLRQFDAAILANVPASQLTPPQIAGLRSYVRDVGGSLLVSGGDHAFGAGAYSASDLDDLMPVTSVSQLRRQAPSVALDLVIDRSGSMYGPKLDAAKHAAELAIQSLQPGDQVGVEIFDFENVWTVPQTTLQTHADFQRVLDAVNGIQARGNTDIYDALVSAGQDMLGSDAKLKHIVVLTDGMDGVSGKDYQNLAAGLRAQAITVSTVAIGADADVPLLASVADAGGGQPYVAQAADDVPALVVEDTRRVAPPALVEGNIQSQPTSEGLSAGLVPGTKPPLLGYDVTTPKPAALTDIETTNGDPLLADWHVGLGRVVAWTSDVRNHWAAGWLTQPSFGAFWGQLVRNALPGPLDSNLHSTVSLAGSGASIQVDAIGANGAFASGATTTAYVGLPDGSSQDVALAETAPGRYEGELPSSAVGAYFIHVAQQQADGAQAQQALTYVIGWPAELRALGPDLAKLGVIAQAGGGQLLTNPSEAFTRDAWSSTQSEPWPVLVALGLVLLLIELGVRRFQPIAAYRESRRPRGEYDVLAVMRALAEVRATAGGFASRDRLVS
ncbi:MAG: VWA domain-containing protein [Chloroflexi bacterium]|nr:VWA domain-containing protein [Chloroflexota bacterium]